MVGRCNPLIRETAFTDMKDRSVDAVTALSAKASKILRAAGRCEAEDKRRKCMECRCCPTSFGMGGGDGWEGREG